MKTDKEILIEAKALIATPDKFCTGAYARDKELQRVHPLSPKAVRWCVLGAIGRAKGVHPVASDRISDLMRKTARQQMLSDINDTVTGFQDIHDLLDRTIARLP